MFGLDMVAGDPLAALRDGLCLPSVEVSCSCFALVLSLCPMLTLYRYLSSTARSQ